MQKIEIIGRVGADAQVKDLGQNQVINFSVAVSETYVKNNEKVTNTTWYEISKWGNNTAVAQYIKKGGLIYVSGKINNRAWVKEDGTAQVVNGINAFEIELLGGKEDSDSTPAPSAETKNSPKEFPQSNMPNSFVDGPEDPESDLPF
jgi:single-strand DNA-binding protein